MADETPLTQFLAGALVGTIATSIVMDVLLAAAGLHVAAPMLFQAFLITLLSMGVVASKCLRR